MANPLNNLSYFVGRLRDCGYVVNKLEIRYSEADPRCWTIVIDPYCANILCTCFRNANSESLKGSEIGDDYFEFHDGGQFLRQLFKIKTNSMEVIISFLNKYGITNKAKSYYTDGPRRQEDRGPNPVLPS